MNKFLVLIIFTLLFQNAKAIVPDIPICPVCPVKRKKKKSSVFLYKNNLIYNNDVLFIYNVKFNLYTSVGSNYTSTSFHKIAVDWENVEINLNTLYDRNNYLSFASILKANPGAWFFINYSIRESSGNMKTYTFPVLER